MAVFVATYSYTSDSERRSAVRPAHREWLRGQPSVLASGPTDDDGAVLVFEAASAAEVEQLLDHDPFVLDGEIVGERKVVGWSVVTGRLADAFPSA